MTIKAPDNTDNPIISQLNALLFLSPSGYSVAGGEFSGDDEEGEGHIYNTDLKCMAEYRAVPPFP